MNIRTTLLFMCVMALVGTSVFAAPFALIKEEEATLPDSPFRRIRGPVPGPTIRFHGVQRTTSPFDLVVEFIPQVAAASINANSLQVWYSKKPLINLTSRIADFVKQENRVVVIRLRDAAAPVGKHQIVFRIEDSDGREVVKPFDIEILPKQ